jgi:N-acetylglucosaminyl-diphospho-decaprenol L-rhamnosyltransferase
VKLLGVVLNWRTADLTLRALETLQREARSIPHARVVVVDNDSQDGSFEKIAAVVTARGWSDIVDVVQSGRNGGFGFGNNVGIRRGMTGNDPAELLYLLNSDATVDEGSLARLVRYMDEHPDVGIAGSAITFEDGTPQQSCFRFPSLWSEADRATRLGVLSALLSDRLVARPLPTTTTDDVDWVAGASMMLRRSMLEQVGLFDEEFFLYYEETDLCLRAKRAGFKVAYVVEASIRHLVGGSTGVKSHERSPQRMPRYMFDSRRRYFLKNHGRGTLWAANTIYALGGATFRLRVRLQGKPDPDRPREWLDWTLYNLRNP